MPRSQEYWQVSIFGRPMQRYRQPAASLVQHLREEGKVDLSELLFDYHDQIVDTWTHHMRHDESTRYAEEPEDELRTLVDLGATAFRSALLENQWSGLRDLIRLIAHKRLQGGFSLPEVQRGFEYYRQTVMALIVAKMEPACLGQELLDLQNFMVYAVTHFSSYYQELHEQFLANQAKYLEREVADRTRKLAESERKYKSLVEGINDGFFVVVRGLIVFANNMFARMHGLAPDEVMGRHYLDLVAPESRADVRAAYTAGKGDADTPARLEYLRLHRDGTRLWTEITAKMSSYDEQTANIGICRDISQRVELERKAREADKLNALAQLAASLAHEINNPLTAVKMNIQLLSKQESVRKDFEEIISTTLIEVEQIKKCVIDMMDLTVPYRLKRKWIDTRDLFKGCLRILQSRMDYQGVTAALRLSPNAAAIYLDPERMEQALVNLLLNSLQALPRGGRIYLGAKESCDGDGRRIEIRVADNGWGIPKEQLPYVFDPFYSKKPGGIGLGLANVRKIVEAHGGTVVVTQRRPTGICFSLKLPRE
ncbi:MAG: ATP-binding protein [Pseudomonadota bacterium]